MRTVVLIGDSIRMRYEDTVRRELHGLAEVRSPKENGGNSNKVLSHLEEWAISVMPDVVHINCGLHDLKKEFGQAEKAVPVDQYRNNVKQILVRLRIETDAIVLWASTTPVDEVLHHKNKPFDRLETDVILYNKVAAEVANEFNVPIDDLFGCMSKAGPEKYLMNDGVHFTAEGYAMLGKVLADFIKPYLKDAQQGAAANAGKPPPLGGCC